MLVLQLNIDEAVIIQVPGREPIRVQVTEIRGLAQKVKVGIDAETDTVVVREELLKRQNGHFAQR